MKMIKLTHRYGLILWIILFGITSRALGQTVDCSTTPVWQSDGIYAIEGTPVQLNGKKYENNWWTQNENPETNSGEWQVWTLLGTCDNNQLPTVNLTSPSPNSVFEAGNTVTLAATATDSDGQLAKVAFFYGGILIGEDLTAPYTVNWSNVPAGNHQLTARATDDQGASTVSDAISITVTGTNGNLLPTASLTAPANQTSYLLGTTITISASASDPDGQITKVAFYQGSNPISESLTAPYTITWTPNTAGTYQLVATAFDNDGASASSQPIEIFITNGNEQFELANLPLQIQLNQGDEKTYTFDAPISSVLSRNRDVIGIQINGNQVTITGNKAGRTGLKITSGNQHYYMGLRINHADGSVPGLPKHLSVGSVSEDITGDLAFWEGIDDIGLTNTEMDIRYIYINGGALQGWRSWGPNRPRDFARNSLKYGLIPFFVYYNIPDGGESYERDLMHVRDVNYMNEYFIDLNTFLDQVEEVMQGDLYGIVLEPDFLGYMQQQSGTEDPTEIATAVNSTTIAPNAGNIRTLVERINQTIDTRRTQGNTIFYGWQLNLWAYPNSGAKGVLRSTDEQGIEGGKRLIKDAATQTTLFAIASGVLTHNANFLSIDKYGLDAMGHINNADPSVSTWFFNNDHWMNYLYYVNTMHQTSGYPIILWQLPVGHINSTKTLSAYTGQPFADFPNTSAKYEDSSSDFFLGDTFDPNTAVRRAYFQQNQYNDPKLQVNGNEITWGSHMQETKDAGVISVLFGAGVGASTDGIGAPPTDDYYWIQRVQSYYEAGAPLLDKEYGLGNDNPCASGCDPIIRFVDPEPNTTLIRTQLREVNIRLAAWDLDGSINSLSASINGSSITLNQSGLNYSLTWLPPAFGSYTLQVIATDDAGRTVTESTQITIQEFDPASCNVAPWDAATVYNVKHTEVSYDGNIYRNKWYTMEDLPSAGDPWEFVQLCSGSTARKTNKETSGYPLDVEPVAFPNPFTHQLTFHFGLETASEVSLEIVDLLGRSVQTHQKRYATKGIYQWQLSTATLPKGVYLYQLKADGILLKQSRLVKQ